MSANLPAIPTAPADPKKNPTYPQRVHLTERPALDALLKTWDERIAKARKKIEVLGKNPSRINYNRLYAQMLGCRDQLSESVRRMPSECGDIYEEDKHKLDQAVAALDRVFAKWDM